MLVLGGGDARAEGRRPWEHLARGFSWACSPSMGEVETTHCFSSGPCPVTGQMERTSSPNPYLTWEPVSMQVHLTVPNWFATPGSSKESQCRHGMWEAGPQGAAQETWGESGLAGSKAPGQCPPLALCFRLHTQGLLEAPAPSAHNTQVSQLTVL